MKNKNWMFLRKLLKMFSIVIEIFLCHFRMDELTTCQICYEKFNETNHVPLVLPTCK